jgi:hypothetical protein
MADTARTESRQELGRRLARFASSRASCRKPFRSFVGLLEEQGERAFFFGGFLRDLMLFGPSVTPRDVDVVVDSMGDGFVDAVKAHLRRRTRFGGLHLEADGWLFDVWSLRSTWAFREGVVSGESFWNLPKTTFLNIQAVVAEVTPRQGRPREIFSHGFFEAIRTRILDINCEENPYPHLCALQALLSAAKLEMSMSPRLARYVLHYGAGHGLEELVGVQTRHYGSVYADRAVLRGWLRAIDEQLASSLSSPVHLPTARGGRQMKFPFAVLDGHFAVLGGQ